ncbi:hypothetical protein G9A89_015483 [Geosiphon pyriformis]|nr:hypothetical protein G9A89_015483 [Geosiphon pyriformis]
MNNLAKQEDIYRWHKESSSSISIVMETKLCSSLQPWIMKRFEGVRVFTSGLDVGFRGTGVAIFVNDSLARHVFKVEEVKGRVLSICLLFKNKLSVSVIGLYACVSGGNHFAQASVINSFIADIVNRSSFVVLDGDFNEDNLVKGASLRKCLSLGLVNVFGGYSLARILTWNNSRGNDLFITRLTAWMWLALDSADSKSLMQWAYMLQDAAAQTTDKLVKDLWCCKIVGINYLNLAQISMEASQSCGLLIKL